MAKKQPVALAASASVEPVEGQGPTLKPGESFVVSGPVAFVEGVDGGEATVLDVEHPVAPRVRSFVSYGQTYEVCGALLNGEWVYRAVRS